MYDINPKILQTPITDDKILLLDSASGHYFELNTVSIDIFNGIRNGASESEILDLIFDKYEIERSQAQQDIKDLIKQLLDKNIIYKKTST